MLLSTLCFGQIGKIQCVPDSLRCLTPREVNTILELGDKLSVYKEAYENMKATANQERDKASEHKKAYEECEKENELHVQKETNFQSDKKVLEDQLSSANKKNALQKVGLWVLGGISAIETGYIGITLLFRGMVQ